MLKIDFQRLQISNFSCRCGGSGHALRPPYWMVPLAVTDLSIRLGRLLFFDRMFRYIKNFMAPLVVFSTQSLNNNNFWQT